MKLDLTAHELKLVKEYVSGKPGVSLLLELKISTALSDAEEIESLDMDDCAGGACKL